MSKTVTYDWLECTKWHRAQRYNNAITLYFDACELVGLSTRLIGYLCVFFIIDILSTWWIVTEHRYIGSH